MNRLLVVDHDPHSAALARELLAVAFPSLSVETQSQHLDELHDEFDAYWVNDNIDAAYSVEKLVFRIQRRQPDALVVVWTGQPASTFDHRLLVYGCDFIARKGDRADLAEVLRRIESGLRTGLRRAV